MKPDLTPEQKAALLAKYTKPAKVLEPTEVLAPTPASEWSSHDPACMDRLIRACITASLEGHKGPAVWIEGQRASGCPQDVYEALRADSKWPIRYRQLVQEDVILADLAASSHSAMDQGPYGVAQMLNTAPKEDITDDEKRRAASFARMGPAELLKEVERHEAVMLGFKEKLLAGKSPPPSKVRELAESAVGLMGDQPRGESAAPLDTP